MCAALFIFIVSGSKGELELQAAEVALAQSHSQSGDAGAGGKVKRGYSRCADCSLLGHTAKTWW